MGGGGYILMGGHEWEKSDFSYQNEISIFLNFLC